jgi:death-on-curing protein
VTEEITYLDLADYLLLGEAILGVDARELAYTADLGMAESALLSPAASFSGVEFYPEFVVKAAVLAVHLIKNHTLPDGNKRLGFMALVEFCERNGHQWVPPSADGVEGDETVRVISAVATGDIGVTQLADWVRMRLGRK